MPEPAAILTIPLPPPAVRRRLRLAGAAAATSFALAAAMSLSFHGEIRADFMITGLVCAVVVTHAISRLARQFRRRLEERTAELATLQHELLIRERMASAGTLAAGVAHEIRSPLMVITIGARNLQDDLAGDPDRAILADSRETVADILRAADQLSLLSRDLATLASPVAEPLGPVELVPVIAAAVRLARYHLHDKIRFVAPPFEAPPVVGSHPRLVQVVLNLLVNAARATAPDRPNSVTVAARPSGEEVILEVSDTGTGMDAATLARAGEPAVTTGRGRGGAGLGLSICHSIVAAAGGRIEIDSRPGAGTRVRVVLAAACIGMR